VKAVRTIVVVLVAALAGVPTGAQAELDKSDNVTLVRHFPFEGSPEAPVGGEGATDIAFRGRYVYAAQQSATPAGGVHIFDVRGPKPRKVGFVSCPGTQNDVAVVKPGLIVLGYHDSTCGGVTGEGHGIRLIDVRNPKRPRYLGAVNDIPEGTHTVTVYPGQPYVYASPGGTGNSDGIEQIIDVSDPNEPKVAATYGPADGGPAAGCHDVTFFIKDDTKVAICAGLREVQIWDVTNPVEPVTIGRIQNPSFFLNHSSDVSDDGKLLVVSDETEAQTCTGENPDGAMWVYDFTNPAQPAPIGYYKIDRGQAPVGSRRADWCTSHNFNFVPGTHAIVASWYASGMNVVDFGEDGSSPREVAHYFGTGEDVANYWSAYWYRGKIYATDRVRGLDVFKVDGLGAGRVPPAG
jgi:hypothetical protein